MKKCFCKLIAVILTLAMTLSIGIITYAAPANGAENTSISELEQFLTKDDNGLLIFDTEAALAEGFSHDIVMAVDAHISSMNDLVIQGTAYIDENYAAIILLPGTRVQGESKIVTYWYGLTQVYMNSDEAQELINNLSAVGDSATIGGFLGFLPGKFGDALGGVANIVGAGTMIYRWQVEQAAASNRGIIMNIQTPIGSNVQSIWFTSQ